MSSAATRMDTEIITLNEVNQKEKDKRHDIIYVWNLKNNINKFKIPSEPIKSDGTVIHAVERIIAYIAHTEGYKYKLVIDSDILKESYLNYEQHIIYTKNNFMNQKIFNKLKKLSTAS